MLLSDHRDSINVFTYGEAEEVVINTPEIILFYKLKTVQNSEQLKDE